MAGISSCGSGRLDTDRWTVAFPSCATCLPHGCVAAEGMLLACALTCLQHSHEPQVMLVFWAGILTAFACMQTLTPPELAALLSCITSEMGARFSPTVRYEASATVTACVEALEPARLSLHQLQMAHGLEIPLAVDLRLAGMSQPSQLLVDPFYPVKFSHGSPQLVFSLFC